MTSEARCASEQRAKNRGCALTCIGGDRVDKQERMRAIRNVIVELAVYGALVTVYAVSVLQLLSAPLAHLYESNLRFLLG